MTINMMQRAILVSVLCALMVGGTAMAQVSAQEAEQLKTTLTPMGAEKTGNKEGTIPAWDGGATKVTPGFKNGGTRPDPYPNEKALFSITSKNMDQYADKLTEATKALLKKYPGFRVDVYPTHRTANAPQWVYDNTFKNATRAKLVNGSAGMEPEGAWGGVPFPIPKSGDEVMWNHQLRWRGTSWHWTFSGYLGTADGKRVHILSANNDMAEPYYFPNTQQKGGDVAEYWQAVSINTAPPIRAGESIMGRESFNHDKTRVWVYLTGQRRTRMLPNACCDTPAPFSAGLTYLDEIEGWTGRLDRFDWKLVGKKEMYIPYNSNKTFAPKINEVFADHYLNPDDVRWELHRVWVVEGNLRPGKRHVAPKNRYYVDEDSWIAVLGDRWDAKGQLWRGVITLPISCPDVPGEISTAWGTYDLLSGTYFVNVMFNEQAEQHKVMPPYPESTFIPEKMASEGVR